MSEEADPTRVVADSGVLAADLLVGGPARKALDHLRRHSWMALVASDHLLDATEVVVADLADETLAGDWRERIGQWRTPVDHPPEDHPALASAYRSGAAHVLSFDESLTSAAANTAVQPHLTVSIRPPNAFARLFDAESLYESVHEDAYPGPDRDPRE
jgi:predicted nucleic acid-binding protein